MNFGPWTLWRSLGVIQNAYFSLSKHNIKLLLVTFDMSAGIESSTQTGLTCQTERGERIDRRGS